MAITDSTGCQQSDHIILTHPVGPTEEARRGDRAAMTERVTTWWILG